MISIATLSVGDGMLSVSDGKAGGELESNIFAVVSSFMVDDCGSCSTCCKDPVMGVEVSAGMTCSSKGAANVCGDVVVAVPSIFVVSAVVL